MDELKDRKRLTFKFWNSERHLKILKRIGISAVILASLIIIKDEIFWQLDSSISSYDYLSDNNYMEETACNVFVIELRGNLTTYIPLTHTDEFGGSLGDLTASENIVYVIKEAEKDENIKAIILEVDSYGGYPVAGEEVAVALKKANKPTVVLIREGGASSAYMAASGADIIFASKNSDIGSIGVTMSYLDYVQQNQKEGLAYISLSSGKFKDTGDPNKQLSREERNLLMRDVNIMHQNFVKMVAINRNLDIEKIEELADGSTMLGEMALENGLIDRIGGMFEVEEYLKEKIGEDVEVCW
jgi:protease IV